MERELLLLGLLRQHEMHGYELHSFIENMLSTCVDLKKPTAYLLLDKMAAAGWIAVHERREGHRPPKRVYRLTAAGEAEFQRLLRENLAQFNLATFSNDVGLAFVEALPPTEAVSLLQRRRAGLVTALDGFKQVPVHVGSLQLVIEHQVHHLTSELAWLDQVLQRF